MAIKPQKKLKVPRKQGRKGDLPETSQDWVGYINDAHDRGVQQRRKHELQWVVNFAYYTGLQNMLFNPRTGLLEIPRDETQPLIVNRIGSFIEARHAKLTKNRPVPRVLPNSKDPMDERAAKFSDQVLLHLWRKIDMEDEYDKETILRLIAGTSFVKTVWDPFDGDMIVEEEVTENGELLLDEDTGRPKLNQIFLGEVSTRALSPFQVVPANDMIPTMKDQEWVIERSFASIVELEKIYPHLRGKIAATAREEIRTDFERMIARLSGPGFANMSNAFEQKKDAINTEVLVKTFWMKPNWQYEKGLVAVVIDSELAMIDVFPNDFGDNQYPIVRFVEREDGYHFWCQSTVERLVPVQKAFNRLRQQKAKNAGLMAGGKWLLPKGSGVSEESITDEEGEIIEYNSSLPAPQQSNIAPMPNYVTQLANELIVDFRDVGGQRESTVTPPPNLTAAVAIETAAELADEVIGPILKRQARSMIKVAQQQLLLANQEYIEPRRIKILGDDGQVAIQMLQAADLRFNTDIHIEVESLFPDFRGAKRQQMMDLWDRRIIQDPNLLLKAMRFGNLDLILEQHEREHAQVKEMIEMLKRGKEPQILPFSNHTANAKELSSFINSPEFNRLIPQRKQLVVQTLQQTLAFLNQQVANQQPEAQTDQGSVNTPFGPQRTVGAA